MPELFKSWVDLIRELNSSQLWLTLAFGACFADWWLLMRFDTGLLGLLGSDKNFFISRLGAHWPLELAYFAVAIGLAWFYLMPMVIVPIWRKLVFEFRWRWAADDQAYPSEKNGWYWLPHVMRSAAVDGNSVLHELCKARQREISLRRHQLTCVLGMLLFGILAVFFDSAGGNSLLAEVGKAWDGLTKIRQLLLIVVSAPGAFVLFIIVGESSADYDVYIHLPEWKKRSE
jgi:hypothetical protein